MKLLSSLFIFSLLSLSRLSGLELWQIQPEHVIENQFLTYSARVINVNNENTLTLSLFNQENPMAEHTLKIIFTTNITDNFYKGDAATLFIKREDPTQARILSHFDQTALDLATPCTTSYERKSRYGHRVGDYSFKTNILSINSTESTYNTYSIPSECNTFFLYTIDNAKYFATQGKITQYENKIIDWEDISDRDWRYYQVSFSISTEYEPFYTALFQENIIWYSSKQIADPNKITFPIIADMFSWATGDTICIFIHRDYPHIQWIVNTSKNGAFCLQAGRVIDYRDTILPLVAEVNPS